MRRLILCNFLVQDILRKHRLSEKLLLQELIGLVYNLAFQQDVRYINTGGTLTASIILPKVP